MDEKHKIKGCPFTRTPLNKYMFKSEQWNYSRIFSIRMYKNFLILTYKNFPIWIYFTSQVLPHRFRQPAYPDELRT